MVGTDTYLTQPPVSHQQENADPEDEMMNVAPPCLDEMEGWNLVQDRIDHRPNTAER
jgi:hypothetical protein